MIKLLEKIGVFKLTRKHLVKFPGNWGKIYLPIYGTVVVIDDSDKCMVGLSAQQIDNLGGATSDVTLSFMGKECDCEIWNAFGMLRTKTDDGIRLTDKAAEILRCKVGDVVGFVRVSDKIKPVRI